MHVTADCVYVDVAFISNMTKNLILEVSISFKEHILFNLPM